MGNFVLITGDAGSAIAPDKKMRRVFERCEGTVFDSLDDKVGQIEQRLIISNRRGEHFPAHQAHFGQGIQTRFAE
ncbi:hypothetical protein D3C75_820620 [compost metagenome]